jgi:hypothetical protein
MSSYDVMIEACDPGIRERVHQLQQWGFNTTDSGDGVSKEPDAPGDEPEVLPFPHIACTVEHPEDLIHESERLLEHLRDFGGVDGAKAVVTATYSPNDETSILFVRWES